jgi:hypothetical protein
MGHKKRSHRSSSGRTNVSREAAKNKNEPVHWWQRISVWVVTLICIPILTGVAVSIISSHVTPSSNASTVSSVPKVNLGLGTNLCARLAVDIQCVLSDIGSNSYMTRQSVGNLVGVPTCADNLPGFMRWAHSYAIAINDALVLSIASPGKATVEIENLRASVIERQPPLRTTQVDCAGGEEAPSDYIYSTVLLDGNPPSVSYHCGTTPCPAPDVTIQPGGSAQLHITAYGYHSLTEWAARVDLIVNGKLITVNLGDYLATPLPSWSSVPDCQTGANGKWQCVSKP